MYNTTDIKINTTLYITTKDMTYNITLPFHNLKQHLIELTGTDDIYSNVQLVSYQSNHDITISKGMNLLFLNNVLVQIAALPESTRENLLDLFSAQSSRTVIDLYALSQQINHYEIISTSLHGIEETKRTAGALFYLAIAADCAITADGEETLTDDYKYNFFLVGIASGGIKIANQKYYIMNSELIRELL